MILKLLITFHKIYCLPFLNTFHEKKMSMPPPPTYTFFHLIFFAWNWQRKGGQILYEQKNLKIDSMILKLSIPLKKIFQEFLQKVFFTKISCLPFLNTFHEKKMFITSLLPPPPHPIHFFTSILFVELVEVDETINLSENQFLKNARGVFWEQQFQKH